MFRCVCFAVRFGFEMFGGYFVDRIAWRMVVQKSLSGVAKAETICVTMIFSKQQAESIACASFGAWP